MRFGMDYLGGARYARVIAQAHPQGWAAGFFANTFGDAYPAIYGLVQTGRCPEIRIHAIWEDNHTYNSKKHDPIILRELARANKLQELYPNVEVFFSPFCEHNMDAKTVGALWNLLRPQAKVKLVNSVWKGAILAGEINEVHGTHSTPSGDYIYSFDGMSAVDSNVPKMLKQREGARTFYFWIPQYNGKKKLSDPTPRPQRKAWPFPRLIKSVKFLADPAGDIKLSAQHIWKSHADQHNVPPEARALKPVFLSPEKVSTVELQTMDGVRIARSSERQSAFEGRHRYYFRAWGYDLAAKLMKASGMPIGRLVAGKKILGRVNPGHRAGTFR